MNNLLTFLSVAFSSLSFFVPSCGLTPNEICEFVDDNLQCTSSPCECDINEVDYDENCDNCKSNLNQGCAECMTGYFRLTDDISCIDCSLFLVFS